MKITGLETWTVEMKLKEPYTIAYETIDKTSNVFIKIQTNTPVVGFGCSAPDLEITGETAESVTKAISEIAKPSLLNKDPIRIAKHLENLREPLKVHPAAKAAIDMALYDILGKVSNLPLWKLLGGFRRSIKTSITIGICSLQETVKEAKIYSSQGFTIFKVKGGLDVESDIKRMQKLREILILLSQLFQREEATARAIVGCLYDIATVNLINKYKLIVNIFLCHHF